MKAAEQQNCWNLMKTHALPNFLVCNADESSNVFFQTICISVNDCKAG